MKSVPLFSSGNKPQKLGVVVVSAINGMPPEIVEWKGKQFIRAYYGGWCYDELPEAVKL